MYKYYMVIILSFLLTFYSGSSLPGANEGCCGRCVGSVYCTACKTCEYCAYCNSGGSCGVCSPTSNERNKWEPPPPSRISPSVSRKNEVINFDHVLIGQVTAIQLNVRSGPGTEYSILARIPNGTVLNVTLTIYPDWLSTSFFLSGNLIHGYVSKKYIRL